MGERHALSVVIAKSDDIDTVFDAIVDIGINTAQRFADDRIGNFVPVELFTFGFCIGELAGVFFADPINAIVCREPHPRQWRIGHEGIDRCFIIENENFE